MLDFKKNRSKILAVATVVVSCTSLVLSVLALNNSKRDCPPEPFKCSQDSHHGKKDCMKRSKDARPHDFDEKGSSEEDHKRPENPQKNEKHEDSNENNKSENPESPKENEKQKS